MRTPKFDEMYIVIYQYKKTNRMLADEYTKVFEWKEDAAKYAKRVNEERGLTNSKQDQYRVKKIIA